MLPFLFAVTVVHTGFQGAQLERVERVTDTHFRCHLKGDIDQDGRNRQANWYYFRVDGAKGRAIVVDLVNLPGEYNYRANRGAVTKDTIPLWSEDNVRWTHFADTEYDAAEPRLRLRITPNSKTLWIAHVPPYTNQHLKRLIEEHSRSPYLRQESVGKTVDGREIPLLTIHDWESSANKKVVWLMFRQHGWETGSSWAAEGAIRFLLSNHPAAGQVRAATIFKIFPLCDPDGVARGNVRFNKFGFDLNRNWDVVDPLKMPEIHAQRKAILDWVERGQPLDLFLSLHNTETSEYLEGPPDPDGRFRALGERFFRLLKEHSSFAPTRDLFWSDETTTSGKAGRMNVIQGLYRDARIPAFLMEQRISHNPRLKRLPTIQDRIEFGAALTRVVAQTAGL